MSRPNLLQRDYGSISPNSKVNAVEMKNPDRFPSAWASRTETALFVTAQPKRTVTSS